MTHEEDVKKVMELFEGHSKCPEKVGHEWGVVQVTEDVTTLKCKHCGDVKTIGHC